MWTALRSEFGLADPEPILHSLVRVFLSGLLTSGWFLLEACRAGLGVGPDGRLDPRVTALFQTALQAKVPHNYFTLWMMTPIRILSGARSVDCVDETGLLVRFLRAAAVPARAGAR
jgi:hypothetical protein